MTDFSFSKHDLIFTTYYIELSGDRGGVWIWDDGEIYFEPSNIDIVTDLKLTIDELESLYKNAKLFIKKRKKKVS